VSASSGWATQQLAEFLAVLSTAADEGAAITEALERLAESFEADAGAFVGEGRVISALGWPLGAAPADDLLAAAGTDRATIEVPGVGPCETVAIPVDHTADGMLVLARAELRFTAEEVGLLRGMARVLALGLRLLGAVAVERQHADANRDLVVSLQARQALLERLSRIQRQISARASLCEVLGAIAAGASELLGDEAAAVLLADEDDPGFLLTVSTAGLPARTADEIGRLPAGSGLAGRAIDEDRLCVAESYQDWTGAVGAIVDDGLRSAAAAPIHLEGRPVGALVVATRRAGRSYAEPEREVLLAFAEHASLALNDARTVRAMQTALSDATHRAFHDELTDLPNRACFYDRTEQALRQAAREGSRTAVLLFDLDRFKEINDTLGHKWGDHVLQAIGPRFRRGLRDGDTLARLGGDEFCVLLPRVESVGDTLAVAERLVHLLEAPFEIDGMTLAVEASCGIATAPTDGDDADVLLQRADVAMYVAKRSHTSIVVYDDDLNVNTPARLTLLSELRGAIARDELVLHYQPRAELTSGQVRGVEALIRWQHPRLGLVPPDQFIPLAEHTGLIKPLTTWVLNTALRELRQWHDRDQGVPAELSVAINLSTRSLLDDGFPAEVLEALQHWGVPAHLIELELTESAIMADPKRAYRLLSELAGHGIRLAIDDFGTGYSSLAYLKNLPVHQLKIDRSFVSHMHSDPNDATIVRSVIDLGHNLGLETIAEGIEDLATWRQLDRLGCDGAQGFFLARPMPARQLEAWLTQRARARGEDLVNTA
jgi:diguanylate cyclase (GGDEF)-like protein